MRLDRVLKFIAAVLVCEAAGFIGSFFTVGAIPGWYSTLAKPALNPPSWVFGPVWTTLYFLMGVSLFLVWSKGTWRADVKRVLSIFAVQLVLNAFWSIAFFGLHSPLLALADMILLWLAIVWTIAAFRPVSATAAWLLVPYLLWVSFASYLNLSIWLLNR